jgi:hypothetical protein
MAQIGCQKTDDGKQVKRGGIDQNSDLSADNHEPAPYPSLTVDWDLYAEYLEQSDLSDDQKREFIETLWAIVVSFVDLGFGVGQPQNQNAEPSKNAPFLSQNLLYSQAIPQIIQDDKSVEGVLRSSAEKEES